MSQGHKYAHLACFTAPTRQILELNPFGIMLFSESVFAPQSAEDTFYAAQRKQGIPAFSAKRSEFQSQLRYVSQSNSRLLVCEGTMY